MVNKILKLRSGSIEFNNHFKQLAVPFKIYADSECVLKRVKSYDKNSNTSYTGKYQAYISYSLAYKVVCIDDKFSKKVVLIKVKNAVYDLIKGILEEYDYCKKVVKKHFNKNLVMSAEDEERFQSSNKCWICNKLFVAEDNKVRDHCHITGKYRGSVHCSCNISLKLTKKVLVIFHNLKGCDGHLIIPGISKFELKISVMPTGLEKYMAFTINNNLVFIDSMQSINFTLDLFFKNLSDNDYKYLSQEFSGELLKLVKQKGVYPYEYMDSFKKFFDEKLPDGCEFYISLKDKCISEKDYLQAINVCNVFKINAIGDYHDFYLKTDVFFY